MTNENAEIIFNSGDGNEADWSRKETAIRVGHNNWDRLSRIVFTDLLHESGLYEQLKRRQSTKVDRYNQIALNPDLPLTKKEVKRANREYTPGFPIWSIPILLGAAAVGSGLTAVEKYSKTNRIGSSYLANKFQNFDRKSELDELIRHREGVDEGLISRLVPEIRLGNAAIQHSIEPTNYVVDIDELLEVAEQALSEDGTNDNLESKKRVSRLFIEEAPLPFSIQDQRVRAAEVFMGSDLLRNGELYNISLERRVDFLPDGDKTFRIRTTLPYAHLYEGIDVTQSYQPGIRLYADRLIDPDPISDLLNRSKT